MLLDDTKKHGRKVKYQELITVNLGVHFSWEFESFTTHM